jgi:hypothetical protein
MITFDQFATDFMAIQQDVIRDHTDDTGTAALCKIMHRDVQLAETPDDHAEEAAQQASELAGKEISASDLDFTVEHHQLHMLLRRVGFDGMLAGLHPTDMLAAMFVIGRRYGMREAARALDSFNSDDAGTEAQA